MRSLQFLPASLLISALAVCALAAEPAAPAAPYLVGRGSADITGPPVGMKMLGYVRPDQIDEGLHLRQYARTFIVAEPRRRATTGDRDHRFAKRDPLAGPVGVRRGPREAGPAYGLENTVIAATHTHAVPAGYWHYGADTSLGSPFYREHFDALVGGIAGSIIAAHHDLRPGHIRVAEGEVEGGGFQRSRTAYLQNPEPERQLYATDIDNQMTLLSFTVDGQPVGLLNWHAVHPTSMSFYNKLISSDNKGYAAYAVEKKHNPSQNAAANGDQHKPERFVAAFAQANCGDVTPNSKLQGEGPGKDDFDSTRIIGGRMAEAAERLLDRGRRGDVGPDRLSPGLRRLWTSDRARRIYARRRTDYQSPAYGYSFAAGSTEDGGGQPIFREGMTKQEPFIDILAKASLPLPTAQSRDAPWASAQTDPAGGRRDRSAVVPGSAAGRRGPNRTVGDRHGPAEFTTMSGRRFRQAVKQALPGVEVRGGGWLCQRLRRLRCHARRIRDSALRRSRHALWSLDPGGYQQEFARLAGPTWRPVGKSESHEAAADMRGMVRPTPLATAYDRPPDGDALATS